MKRLISKEFFNFTLNHYKWYFSSLSNSSNANLFSRIHHDTYIPYYTLDFRPQPNLPIEKLLSSNMEPDAFDIKYGNQSWMRIPWYVKFIKECFDRGLYHIIFLSSMDIDYQKDKDMLRTALLSRADYNATGTSTTHFPKNCLNASSNSTKLMFDCIRLCNTFVEHYIRYTNGDRKSYLTNMFFLGELSKGSTIPLIVGMVEKSRSIEARTHFMNNTPMPTDLLELWVDSSVEEIGSKIKPLYRKYLKSGIENAGITIKVFPSLSKEIMFSAIPYCESIEKESERNSSILSTYYDYAEGILEADRSIYGPVHLDTLVKDIEEVFAAIEN